jgi:hypothetical protein
LRRKKRGEPQGVRCDSYYDRRDEDQLLHRHDGWFETRFLAYHRQPKSSR